MLALRAARTHRTISTFWSFPKLVKCPSLNSEFSNVESSRQTIHQTTVGWWNKNGQSISSGAGANLFKMDIQRIRLSCPRPTPEIFFKNNIAIQVTQPDCGDENFDYGHISPLRVRRKRSTPLTGLDQPAHSFVDEDKNKDSDSQTLQSLSPLLARTKRRFSAMVSSAAAAVASRRLSAFGWSMPAPALVKPQIVRQGRALCLQYIKTHIRRALIDQNKKKILLKRLQLAMESECAEDVTRNLASGVAAAMRALCAALERKRPEAFQQVARQATRAPSAMLRSDTALAELALALARRITRDSITWSKVAAIFCMCGALAREATEAANGQLSLELVTAPAAAVADLLHEETGTWIADHGGWDGLVERLRSSTRDDSTEKPMRILMWFFVVVFIMFPVMKCGLYTYYRHEQSSS